MGESAEKKFLVALMGLFSTFLIVVAVLGAFTFNEIRAGNARIEANIAAMRAERQAGIEGLRADMDRAGIEGLGAERQAGIEDLCAEQKADVDKLEASIQGLRAEQKAGIDALRAEQRADIDMLSDKVDALDANLDTRLDEIEREQARTQGAIDVLRGRQAPNP